VIRSATPKLKSYVALSACGLFLCVATGRIELVALVSPLWLSVLFAATIAPSPTVDVEVSIDTERCIEQDELNVTVALEARRNWNEVELALALPDGLSLIENQRLATIALAAGVRREHTWHLRADRWGAKRLGLIGLRLHGPGRLTVFESLYDKQAILKVYPAYERISRALRPIDTQIYSGDYVSRAAADGIEFSAVRPFVPGDSVRRVNWRITSRRNMLHVNLAQPERDTDVVLFLDTFSQADLTDQTTLDLTVRGASVIARHHLAHNDRIGLVSFGGMLRWLFASMGRTHTYRVADFLIDVNTTFSWVWKDIELLPDKTLPPSATIIAFSPLVDDRTFKALADINTRGFPVVVINTLVEDKVTPSPGPEGELAHRAWLLQRAMKRDRLQASGIPVADWSGKEPIQAALAQFPQRRRRIGARR
jgi:uncharacterized protein (DUF58 family)